MRYHLTYARMALSKRQNNRKFWQGYWEMEALVHCWWEWKLVQSLWKAVWRFLNKLKIELPYYPAIPLLDIHLKEMKSLNEKDICTPMFIVALFIIAKLWKQPMCPLMCEWIKNICHIYKEYILYIYIYNGILFSH